MIELEFRIKARLIKLHHVSTLTWSLGWKNFKAVFLLPFRNSCIEFHLLFLDVSFRLSVLRYLVLGYYVSSWLLGALKFVSVTMTQSVNKFTLGKVTF